MVTARPQRQRRSIRLPSYDYGHPGSYFVTVCTNQRLFLLGEVVGGEVNLSPYGAVVMNCGHDFVNHYAHVELDAFVVMPNHIHGIIVLTDVDRRTDVGAGLKPAPTTARDRSYGLPEIVRAFKTFSSRRINEARATPGESVWQRNYYERVIRDEAELDRARQYIVGNPANWSSDVENPDVPRSSGQESKRRKRVAPVASQAPGRFETCPYGSD